jgi:hypothetical protein
MIKKSTIMMLAIFFAVFGTVSVFAAGPAADTKVIPMPDLLKPEGLTLDDTQMYITEGTNIYIYSLEDFKLVKKFGKKGEGPKEFMINPFMPTPLRLSKQGDDLMVHSSGKVSWWTKDGAYIKEIKTPTAFMRDVQAFGNKIVGIRITVGQERIMILSAYDDKFKELKELIRVDQPWQQGKGTRVLETTMATAVYDNKLYMAWGQDFSITVFDADLKELKVIKREEKRRKVTETFKKDVTDHMKTDPSTRDFFAMLKPIIVPEYFPAIAGMIGTGNKLYVMTFQEYEDENGECLIMDLDGKLLKRVFLPLKMATPIMPYPFAIHKGFLYQVIEDVEEEEWSLHITKIE